jgi:hypothetical protein
LPGFDGQFWQVIEVTHISGKKRDITRDADGCDAKILAAPVPSTIS